MKLYIVRHGQTIWNKERRMQGWMDSPLTEEGIEGAIKLGKRLENVDFDMVYSSPLGRTQATTKHILGAKKSPIVLLDDLKEINLGGWEGEEFTLVEANHKDRMEKLFYDPENYEAIDGENYSHVYERAERAFEEITKNPYEDVLLVSHGIWINVFFSLLKKKKIKELWDAIVLPNTSLSLIEIDEDKNIDYILEGDIAHLI